MEIFGHPKIKRHKTSYDKIDYAHKLIYDKILQDKRVQYLAHKEGLELTGEIIHDIVEHNRQTIAECIAEKIKVIKIPYLGRMLIKEWSEPFYQRVILPLKTGRLTWEEAMLEREKLRQEILETVLKQQAERRKAKEGLSAKTKMNKQYVRQKKVRLKISFIKDKREKLDKIE